MRRRRLAAGLTQYELADKVGVEQPSIHRIEKGRQGWDSKTVWGIAAALNTSLGDLFVEVEQVMPKQLPLEATNFARVWLMLPHEMREEYRRRIEALANAMKHPVRDELARPDHRTRRRAKM